MADSIEEQLCGSPIIMTDRELVLDYAQLRADNGQPFRLNVGNESHFIVHTIKHY